MTQVTPTTKRTTRKAQAAPPHVPPPVAETSKPAPATEVAARTPQQVAPIPQSAMQDAAFARNWWRVVIDAERTPYDSVLADVAVWGPNEAKLRAGDLVEVVDEQSTLFAPVCFWCLLFMFIINGLNTVEQSTKFVQLISLDFSGVPYGCQF